MKRFALKIYNHFYRVICSLNVGIYTTCRTLKYTQRRKSDDEVLTSLSVSTHIVEKGLTMPERRLGFGLPRIESMIEMLLSNKNLSKEQRFQYAISVLLEYERLHAENKVELPIKVQEGFIELRKLFNGTAFLPQYKFSRDEFFKNSHSDFETFAKSRHTVRNFESAANIEDVVKAVELAKTAPSACNRQATKVHIFTDEAKVQKILSLQNGNRGFGHLAKQVLLLTFDTRVLGLREQNDGFTNLGMFAMNLSYALHYHSICSCILNWSVTAQKDKKLRKVADIPDNETIVLVMIIGIPPKDFMVAKSERKETSKFYTIHS